MRRREFITLLGGVGAWPLAAKGQPPDRMRRVGVLMNTVSDEQEAQARIAAFSQALQEYGWEGNGRGRLYPPRPSAVIIVHLIDRQAVATLQF